VQLFKYWKKSPPSHVLQRMRYEFKPEEEPTVTEPGKTGQTPTDMDMKIAQGLPKKLLGSEPIYRQEAIRKALAAARERMRGGG
jgi:hypothetical protein